MIQSFFVGGNPSKHENSGVVCSAWLKLRLVFPTIQQNMSVMSVLPTFLDTLGRKIENAEREKDWGSYS